MTEIYHGIGWGDFLQAESYWSEQDRAELKRIYWCGWAERLARPCFEAVPELRHVEHVTLNPEDVTDDHRMISSMKFHGVLHRLPFTGSSFLKHTLAEPEFDLPERYDFIQLTTPFNDPSTRKLIRDVQPQEWDAVIRRLEDRDTTGVVINSAKEQLPDHPRLLDLSGKTTMPEAIEILKHADGYTGIDSCFAIFAAQLFPAEDLLIRTRNPWVDRYRWWFYAPHESFPFLVYTVGERPYDDRPKPTLTGIFIELRKRALIDNRVYQVGEVVEVSEKRARYEIENGNATRYPLENPPARQQP